MSIKTLMEKIKSRGSVTPVTRQKMAGVTAKPAYSLGCTPVTSVTPGFNDGGESAQRLKNCGTSSADITAERIVSTTERFRAASMALDALQAQVDRTSGVDTTRSTTTSVPVLKHVQIFGDRASHFMYKGLAQFDAEELAQGLAIRDRDNDDRRLCLECRHFAGYGQTSWRCGNWQAAGVAIRERDAQLPADFARLLQRCDGFKNALQPPATATNLPVTSERPMP